MSTGQLPVVVGVKDGTSGRALRWAADEASRRGRPLLLIHAYAVHLPFTNAFGRPLAPSAVRHLEDDARRQGQEVLDASADAVSAQHPDLRGTAGWCTALSVHAWEPDSPLILAPLAATREAHLLVAGTRSGSGFTGLLQDSVSRCALQRAEVPVALVRRGQFATEEGD